MIRTAKLALEDGTILEGEGFGAETIKAGEIVFSTSMTGYVAALTDESKVVVAKFAVGELSL